MSEMSEKARAEGKEKVKRLTSGGKDDVDASGWTEDEYGSGLMHTEKKLGNRPISKQNLACGGKAAHRHGGRKSRDMGGQMSNAGAQYVASVSPPPQNRFGFSGNQSPLLAAAGLKKGGKADGRWMEKAFSNSHGQLHKELGVPKGEKIPAKKLDKAEHAKSGLERKRANLVKIAERSNHAKGGMVRDPVRGDMVRLKEDPSYVAKGSPTARGLNVEKNSLNTKPAWVTAAEKSGNYNAQPPKARKDGGQAEEINGERPKGGRMPRASGGSAGKGKMNVNIIIAQKPDHQMMPGGMAPGAPAPMKPPMPMPLPGAVPPMGPQGAPAGPMPGGPNMPPPSMQPPMGRATGGKVYPDMKFSAANGKGRMEKANKYGP